MLAWWGGLEPEKGSAVKRFLAIAVQTLGAAFVLAFFFVFLEMVKASRSSQWSGTTWFDYLGLGAGLAVYVGVLFLLTLLVAAPLELAGLRRAALPVGIFIAGAVTWAVLSRYREITPTFDDVFVAAGLLAFALALALLPLTGRVAAPGVCTLAAMVWLAGISALVAAGDCFLFDVRRSEYVTVAPLLWMGMVVIPGLGVWFYTYSLRVVYALAVVILPQALSAVLCTESTARNPEAPNLVLIVSDALRADYISTYGGHVPTPHLDRLAQKGALFEESYALSPWTLPSMTAMFASEYPAGLTPGVDGQVWLAQIWQYGLHPQGPAFAEQLKQRGYATAAITSNALMWTIPELMNGFETRATAHPILLAQEGLFRHLPFLQDTLAALFPALDGLRPHNASADMANYVHAYLQRVQHRPFFLWVHYIDPHAPYDPPHRYRRMHGPWPFFYPYAGGERWGIPRQGPGFAIEARDHAYVQSLYEGEIRYVDELVGKLLMQLETLGVRDKTYICLTSDHGEELWDHGDWGHGHAVYQEALRVPLVLAGPGIKPQRIPGPMSAIDLIPTLADLAGVEKRAVWRGRSLAPVLRGESPHDSTQDIFVQGTSNRAWPNPMQAVISGGWKLIRKAGSGAVSLYDLKNDPKEKDDVTAKYPERVADLTKRLDDWLASFPSTFPAPSQGTPLNKEMVDKLRTMGYL